MMTAKRKYLLLGLLLLLLAGVGAAAYFLIRGGYLEQAVAAINSDLPPLLFITLAIVLPALGFPISVILIVAGIKFGVFPALLLWLMILPLHTGIAFAAARSLRPLLEKLLFSLLGYTIPSLPARSEAMFSFLFLALPGLPYAAKNYLLPLTGVSFRYCVVMNCAVQSVLGFPFILLGHSGAEMDPTLFYAAVLVLGLLFFLLHWLKKRYGAR